MTMTDAPAPEPSIRHPSRVMVTAVSISVGALLVLGATALLSGHLGRGGASQEQGAEAAHPALPAYLRLFVAVVVIAGLAHCGGWLVRRIGQPAVVGEIAVGILLGPSILGRLAPGVSHALFPDDIRVNLNLLAQVGVVLFMFAVGMEFDVDLLRRQRAAITTLGQATMVVPLVGGILVTPLLYPKLHGTSGGFTGFAVFMGVAISITAFPVLARIVQDTGLAETRLGRLAMTCACIDDVLAWCAFSVIIARMQLGGSPGALLRLPLIALVAWVLLAVVKPRFQALSLRSADWKVNTAVRLVAILTLVFALAALTDQLGVHAVFGAFLAGLILPRDSRFLGELPERLGAINRALLLPVFFASTGLALNITGVLAQGSLLWTGLLIAVVAVGAKVGSAAVCAAAGGMPWRESLGLGVLLSTRGVTEIVFLGIGLQIGVINVSAFTIMVLMALVTTVITTPVLHVLGLVRNARAVTEPWEAQPQAVPS
jgi:Kef-type K+ transport system membrane component KefB